METPHSLCLALWTTGAMSEQDSGAPTVGLVTRVGRAVVAELAVRGMVVGWAAETAGAARRSQVDSAPGDGAPVAGGLRTVRYQLRAQHHTRHNVAVSQPPPANHHGVTNIFDGSAHIVVQAGNIGTIVFPEPPAQATRLDQAAHRLARMVSAQWQDEIAAQGLFRTAPLAVRWRIGRPDLADHPANVGGQVAGTGDDLDRLAANFRRLPQPRLVVLGPAGSGKTTLAILLALTLLRDARPADPGGGLPGDLGSVQCGPA